MRIIKAAKKLEECIAVCDNCKSILGLTMNDLSNEAGGFSFYCAICGCMNHIKAEHTSDLFPWVMEDDDNDRKIQGDNLMRKYEV